MAASDPPVAPVEVVLMDLMEALSPRLVAYIAGETTTSVLRQWSNREAPIPFTAEARIRLAWEATSRLLAFDDKETVQAWFQGLNPALGDVAPARLLRDDGNADENRNALNSAVAAWIASSS